MNLMHICLSIMIWGIISFAPAAHSHEKAFSALIAHGFKSNDLVNAIKKYPELKDMNSIYDAKINQNQYIIYSEDSNDSYLFTKSAGELTVEKNDVIYETEVKGLSGSIRKNLYDSVFEDVKSESVASQVSEAFKEEFPNLRVGRVTKSYELQVEHQYVGDRFIRYGKVLSAALIIGKATSRRIYQMNTDDYSWTLLPENSKRIDKPFYLPVDTQRVSSLFQLNRQHPLTRRHQPHKGIDFASPSGSNIYPALDGEVVVIARSRSKGKFITLKHDNGYETTYIHLKMVVPNLRVGMRVELGEKIGEVGRTGFSTGAHLHFGVIENGLFINPIYLMKGHSYNHRALHENKILAKNGLDIKNINNSDDSQTIIDEPVDESTEDEVLEAI